MADPDDQFSGGDRASAGERATPTPRRVRCPLRTQGEIGDELARLYRRARAGEIDVQAAGRLAYVLSLLAKVLEAGDLERRIEALEAQQ